MKINTIAQGVFLLGATLLTSCSSDDDTTTPGIEEPANYTFSRNNETTVSFSGQTTRILMAEELVSSLLDETFTEIRLDAMYDHQEGDNDFSDATLNASDKNLKSKTAASIDFFSANTVTSSAIKSDFELWISGQVSEVFPNWNGDAAAGQPGAIQEAGGGPIRYVNGDGVEYNQIFGKSLIGALMLDQALNNYLSTAVLDEADNVENNNNGTVEEGTNYTTMEHKWDDKAGIAEIITAMEYLVQHPEIKHGKIRVGFTPDEEIGRGAHKFDVKKFGADWAYTMDGSQIGELEYENFNAAGAVITVKGKSVHPGYAKGKMVNSILIAQEFIDLLPKTEVPEHTEDREGFFHLHTIKGNVEETILQYIIRDHDKGRFENRKQFLKDIASRLNKEHNKEAIEVEITDQYFNMKEKVEPVMHIVDIAEKAMIAVGVEPIIKPIRGGTDGSQLSYMGLPCPNIFAGGHNFHGRYEYVPVESMVKAVEVIVKIAEITTAYNR